LQTGVPALLFSGMFVDGNSDVCVCVCVCVSEWVRVREREGGRMRDLWKTLGGNGLWDLRSGNYTWAGSSAC